MLIRSHEAAKAVPIPDDIFGWVAKGDLTVYIGGRYPITQVSEAFSALEARRTTGKLLLVR